jgi:glycosyltransferase involved in cell wall biosynthesis
MTNDKPLISCICITKNRSKLLRRAIECFRNQELQGNELLICYPQSDVQTQTLITVYKGDSQILFVERPNDMTLGNARNHLLYKCRGSYICIWDDDDWHHPQRLSKQYNSIKNNVRQYQGSILTRIFLYDYTTDLAYLSFSYPWDGTLLCRKEILLQNPYANRNKGEDTHVVPFLHSRGIINFIQDEPTLYIYTYHGGNTWDYEHFQIFIEKSTLLNTEYQKQVKLLLKV